MSNILLKYLITFFLAVLIFIIVLSITGKSTGLRELFVRNLIQVFEWAADVRAEVNEELKEKEKNDLSFDGDEITNDLAEKNNHRRQILPDDRPLIDRHWSEKLEQMLHDPNYELDMKKLKQLDCNNPDKTITVTRMLVHEIFKDTLSFFCAGVEAIIEDKVTARFQAAQLPSWNLLTRSRNFVNSNWKLNILWTIGVLFRYFVFFPLRLAIFVVAMMLFIIIAIIIGFIPNERIRIVTNKYAMLSSFRVFSRAVSLIATFHNKENRAKGGIVVANHTSPIDVMVLCSDNSYALVGQQHGGMLGFLQTMVSRCTHHIWFDRSEAKDRILVRKKLQEHVNDSEKLPVLIFPEGTCINNTSIFMFKKGSFEVTDVIYPIAIKYDNRLGDAFWNSSKQGYFSYIIGLMTSWALICEVWYLPPVHRNQNEDSIDFARRVKHMIAEKGGLVDLEWDGNLKRTMVPEKLKISQKELFYQYLARTMPIRKYSHEAIKEIHRLNQEDALEEAVNEIEHIMRRNNLADNDSKTN